ncbi:MAG TPA: ELM1/GtrOC1 family putative glycosyltransferase, partial [Candidatus Binatia bacterium]|nr:ELM1/GtrOC1 family putative glycosyltransferase [Candidatus Binatia bacterium]
FLLIEHYWAMIVFAVVWQFAAGVLDRCDGETARVRNYESEAGGQLDTLIDDLRFGLPFAFLTVACYREFPPGLTYVVVAAATLAWYGTAATLHTRFLHRAGYVSMQAMGEDFFKAQAGAWVKPYRGIQPFIKGDIRTFYLFLLTFLGRKNVLFWTLVVYAWPLGVSYLFTIKKFRLPSENVQSLEGGRRLDSPPTVWVLTDDHPGNTTQSLGLAKALGWPYEVKELHFTPFIYLHEGLFGAFGATRIGLKKSCSASLASPWPDLVITTGWRTEHLARWIKKQSRGHTRLIQLGRKGGRVADLFDLVVSCTYFRLPPHPRRIETTAPLTQVTPEQLAQAAACWQGLFANAPHPRIALLVGGTSPLHRLDAETARRLGVEVSAFAQAAGGSVFATTSRRTGQEAAEALRRGLGESRYVHLWQPGQRDNPYLAYLALADVIVVTGESESMLAEAAATGKPVYIYPLPKRQPGLWIQLKEWVVARSQGERLDTHGTVLSQQGLAYLCARLVERGIILPQQDLHVLHQTLICRGNARFFGEPLGATNRPVLREVDEVVRRVRVLMGMSEEQGPHPSSPTTAAARGTAEKAQGLD